MLSYAELKMREVYNTVEVINEDGMAFDDSITEEELNGMQVNGYFIKDGHLVVELTESIQEYEDEFDDMLLNGLI